MKGAFCNLITGPNRLMEDSSEPCNTHACETVNTYTHIETESSEDQKRYNKQYKILRPHFGDPLGPLTLYISMKFSSFKNTSAVA